MSFDRDSETSQGVKVEVHRGLQGLSELSRDWRLLIERGAEGGFALSFASYDALLRYRHATPDNVMFLCLRDNQGTARAICPLVVERRKVKKLWLQAWCFPSDPDRPSSSFLVDPELPTEVVIPAILPALRAVKRSPELMMLDRVEEGSPTWRISQMAKWGIWGSRGASLTRFHPGKWESELPKHLPKKFRRNLRWCQHRLNKLGNVRHRVITTQPELQGGFEAFLSLEASGWKGRDETGRAMLRRSNVVRHARGLVALHSELGQCELHVLELDGEFIAAVVCFLVAGDLFAFKIARNERYASLSLGHLGVYQLLVHSAKSSVIKSVNFGWEADWISPWRPTLTPLWDICMPVGACGRILARALFSASRSYKAL